MAFILHSARNFDSRMDNVQRRVISLHRYRKQSLPSIRGLHLSAGHSPFYRADVYGALYCFFNLNNDNHDLSGRKVQA